MMVMALDKAPSEKDVSVLLTFLSDPNPHTVALAKKQLKQILERQPGYRDLLEKTDDPTVAREARAFLEEARLEEVRAGFEVLVRQGEDLDLERGVILLAQSAYPQLQTKTVTRALDRLAEDVEDEVDAQDGAISREVAILRRYLFEREGFTGNERDYYDPENSYINKVLERRTGIPISLSCVYLLLTRRLDVETYGVGLPGHFIVAHAAPSGVIYIDPFHHGRVLTRNDCVEIVRQRGLGFQETFLSPTPNRQIIARMIVNLVTLYTERGAEMRVQWLSQLLALLEQH